MGGNAHLPQIEMVFQPSDVVFVGDSPTSDIAPAHAAGMRTVWVMPSGGAPEEFLAEEEEGSATGTSGDAGGAAPASFLSYSGLGADAVDAVVASVADLGEALQGIVDAIADGGADA